MGAVQHDEQQITAQSGTRALGMMYFRLKELL
jgi:hypothetical protein